MSIAMKIEGRKMTLEYGVERPAIGRALMVTNVEGWDGGGTEVRSRTRPRAQAHGTFSERNWRGSRVLSVEGIAWADTRREAAEIVDELNGFLADGTFGTFEVIDPDLGRRWARGKLIGDGAEVIWDGQFDIEFAYDIECPDPRKYGELQTFDTPVATGGGGLRFDLFTGAPFDPPTRTNHFPNPSFDSGSVAPSALGYNTTIAYSATGGVNDGPCAKFTASTANYIRGTLGIIDTAPAETWTYSCWVSTPVAGKSARLEVDFNVGTTYKSTIKGSYVDLPADTMTRLSLTVTVPAGIDNTTIMWRMDGAAKGQTFNMDQMLAEKTRSLGSYFDGNSAAPTGFVTQWTGTPGNSVSVMQKIDGAKGVLDFGDPGELGTITFTNYGTADTYPLFRVRGYTPSFTITEVETGRRLEYIGEVGAYQDLFMDSWNGAVYLEHEEANRLTNMARVEWPSIPGHLPGMPPEQRTYRFESPGGLNAQLFMEVSPAWW